MNFFLTVCWLLFTASTCLLTSPPRTLVLWFQLGPGQVNSSLVAKPNIVPIIVQIHISNPSPIYLYTYGTLGCEHLPKKLHIRPQSRSTAHLPFQPNLLRTPASFKPPPSLACLETGPF